MHAHMYVCKFGRMYLGMHTCTYVCMYVCMYIFINNYPQVNHQLISSDIHYHNQENSFHHLIQLYVLPLETASATSYG